MSRYIKKVDKKLSTLTELRGRARIWASLDAVLGYFSIIMAGIQICSHSPQFLKSFLQIKKACWEELDTSMESIFNFSKSKLGAAMFWAKIPLVYEY